MAGTSSIRAGHLKGLPALSTQASVLELCEHTCTDRVTSELAGKTGVLAPRTPPPRPRHVLLFFSTPHKQVSLRIRYAEGPPAGGRTRKY